MIINRYLRICCAFFCVILFLAIRIYMIKIRNITNDEDSIVGMVQIFKTKAAQLCSMTLRDRRDWLPQMDSRIPTIYFVTPSYPRPEQIPELTRLSHTLMLVPRIHWVVADDTTKCSERVLEILKRSGIPFTHISSPKPYKYNSRKPRGVFNRRAAIKWILKYATEGILYFGDDDNTYDLELFDEIRKTKKLAMWPVGLVGAFGVTSPVLRDGKVIGFFDSWPAKRHFAVDMAGFAINLKYLNKSAFMPNLNGYIEDKFLLSLGFKFKDIEPLARNCTKVLVWHTQTRKFHKPALRVSMKKLESPRIENTLPLINELLNMEVVDVDPDNGTAVGFISCANNRTGNKMQRCYLTEKKFIPETCC